MAAIVTIRVVEPEDTLAVANVVISMLSDSPLAFGESLLDAQNRSQHEWQALVDHLVASGVRTAFLAFDEQGACGFICADSSFPEAPPETVVISRLWVSPRQRGSGLGRRLMEAATSWARDKRAAMVALGVTEMNTQAIQFYEHLGYSDLGMRVPWPQDPHKKIIILGRKLEA